MPYGVETKYLFRCDCGYQMRMFMPDRIDCPVCSEPMELSHILKISPGFGIGKMSTRAYFHYDPPKDVDKDGDVVL